MESCGMTDTVFNKWNSDIITGDRQAEKPNMIALKNAEKAARILNKHIKRNSLIGVHCDVDMDGIGCGFVLKQFLQSLSSVNHLFIINKEKVHGIQGKHVEYFNNVNKIDLLIILDSSTNEIEFIKGLQCDVIVIDHHEVLQNDFYGVHENGTEYVIVNNMIENNNPNEIVEWIKSLNNNTSVQLDNYVVDERMSGTLVLYELLRIYSEAYNTGPILENKMLYQWVGITLFTDAVTLATDRNQWYIDKTVHNMDLEPNLKTILTEMNKYKARADKSFINYTLAPAINKTIRAGASGVALDIIINKPYNILELNQYRQQQDDALKLCVENRVYSEEYIAKDISNLDISSNYCGVIAGRLCGDNHKNTIVYKIENGIAKGSFRGRYADVDYRKQFESFGDDIYAQGHKPAFGFKIKVELIDTIMKSLKDIEPINQHREYLTAGRLPNEHRGIHHIESIDDFKKQGNLWRLAIGNSKVSSYEEINIVTSISEAVLKETQGKIYIYNVLGMDCKAFEPLTTDIIKVYVEYSTGIDFYVRNS